jgi:hypothetical protein
MQKIIDIYKQYKIIPVLQSHQLQVAAVADQICESMNMSLDRNSIVAAALLHDMGNVIKFDLAQTKLIFNLSDSEIEDIEIIKEEFIEKYGDNEHEAAKSIAQEIGLPEKTIDIVFDNRFSNMCVDRDNDNWASKIVHYADARVSPKGILSYDERMEEANKRYKNHKNRVGEEEHTRLVGCGKDIEKQIFAQCKIKPEDITNESIKPYMEKLKDFEI